MRKYYLVLFFITTFFLFPFYITHSSVKAQDSNTRGIRTIDTIDIDSNLVQSQRIAKDTLKTDTIQPKKSGLDAPVEYEANDSIIFTAGNIGYLYGESNVKYQTIDLKAEHITAVMDSNIFMAKYGIDSIGAEFGFPVLTDKDQTVEAKTMRYNYKTQKGYITDAITEQGEGYINAGRTKRNTDGSFFICDGKYTTCDNHDHPHFYFNLTKAKMRPGKDVITGPVYLVIEDLPIKFIGLPFAFFPFTSKYSSGVIMPSYGDELQRGFSLRDGGYYFAISDHIDLALTGEIFTKGTWGVRAASSYAWRYKSRGSFNIGYLNTKYGDKASADYYNSKDFDITWSHAQDPKANMYRTFTAGVSFKTSSYDRNQLNQAYNYNTTNTSSSSTVTLNQRFPDSPWSFTAAMTAYQNKADSSVALTLPNMTITMSRIFPFKRKEGIGSEKWYEKISLSYTGDFRNSLTTKEDQIFKASFKRDWNKAMKHSIPVSATFSVLNYLNITPSLNYTERWYTNGVKRNWNGSSHVAADTIYGFKRVYDFNASLGFQTKLYGFYEPLFNMFGIKRIRHVFTPSVSLGMTPDFSSSKYGFYETYYYMDANGEKQPYTYSPYAGNIFGTAPGQKSGSISFNFQNNIEAKVMNFQDSLVVKSLVDNFNIAFSYNMMAEQFKWSDISTSVRLKLSKTLTVNINAQFDPYTYDVVNGTPQRVDVLRISKYGTLGRLKSTGYSISPSFNQDTFKKWFGKKSDKEDSEKKEDTQNMDPTQSIDESGDTEAKPRGSLLAKKEDDNEYDADGYIKNEVKWNLNTNFSMNYGYGDFDYVKKEYKGKLYYTFGFGGSIQPTKNWNFNFNTNYDFDNKKFSYVNCGITRNLHCWSLSANFIPVGDYKSYFITLRVNSSMLQDLKYEQRNRGSATDASWY